MAEFNLERTNGDEGNRKPGPSPQDPAVSQIQPTVRKERQWPATNQWSKQACTGLLENFLPRS